MNIFWNAVHTTLAGMKVQLVQKYWNMHTNYYSLGLLQVIIEPQISSSRVVIRFQVVCRVLDFFVSMKKKLFSKLVPYRGIFMEWTKSPITGCQKSMRRFGLFAIQCWKCPWHNFQRLALWTARQVAKRGHVYVLERRSTSVVSYTCEVGAGSSENRLEVAPTANSNQYRWWWNLYDGAVIVVRASVFVWESVANTLYVRMSRA